MKPFNMIVTYLQNHPIVGILSAWSGAGLGFFTSVLTSDAMLKTIGVASLYVGFFVGLLTGIIKIIELIKMVRKK